MSEPAPKKFVCRRRISRIVPKAKGRKQLGHWLVLSQPLLQILALVGLALLVSGCSPLASSTEKNRPTAASLSNSRSPEQGSTATNTNAMEKIAEDSAKAEAKEISSSGAEVVSESDFRKLSNALLAGGEPLHEDLLNSLIRRRASLLSVNRPKLLFFSLSEEQQKKFLAGEELALPLEALQKSSDRAKQSLTKHLQEENRNFSLHGTLYWVVQDSAKSSATADNLAKSDFPLLLRFYLGKRGEAYLFLKRSAAVDPVLGLEQEAPDAALIQAALRDTKFLALVLE